MNCLKHKAVIHHFVGTQNHTYLDCPLPLWYLTVKLENHHLQHLHCPGLQYMKLYCKKFYIVILKLTNFQIQTYQNSRVRWESRKRWEIRDNWNIKINFWNINRIEHEHPFVGHRYVLWNSMMRNPYYNSYIAFVH